ncbi:unnamed protein product [Withania somnifera]
MTLKSFILTIAILAVVISISHASDPSPLQDFCVAVNDPMAAVFVNGKFCKDPKDVSADDFFRPGLNVPGNTSNQLGSAVIAVNVNNLSGLNTLGISLARIDYGTLYVGFILSNAGPNLKNKLFTKILHPGDVFIFPIGLIHFQFNVEKTKAVAFAGLGSQNPGVITIANAIFGSDSPINDDVLAKAFQVDKKVLDYLQSQFWWDNN